jgi:branched-chain amino acid transport system ATP-binding protein
MRAPDTNEILLQVEGVSLAFGGVKALTDISFDIMKGEIRAIIGPNGAGKTSMLNVINGFYHPDHGAITFKGRTRARMQPFVADAALRPCPGGGDRASAPGRGDRRFSGN